MFEIFVCDDDICVTDFLKNFIQNYYGDNFKIVTVNTIRELLGMIQIRERIPDALIMDINMNDGNGIDTVKEMQTAYPNLKVIYLTGVIDYATAIFETNPSYFLVKPIDEKKLCDAINKVRKEIEKDKANSIVIKSNGSELVLDRKDIVYVESQGRKLIFCMADGTRNEVYEKMSNAYEQLGKTFVRSHKSFLINMKYITERTNKEFHLSNGVVLPISKSNLKEAKLKFISYLGDEL